MAVCGRCILCGHKFSGEGDDEAVRWACVSDHAECIRDRKHSKTAWGEVFEHAICRHCHDGLVSGDLNAAVADLVTLLQRRRES